MRMFFFLVTAVLAMTSFSYASADSFRQYMQQGGRAMIESRQREALELYRMAAEEGRAGGNGEHLAEALLEEALLHDICGAGGDALKAYDRALDAALPSKSLCRRVLFFRGTHFLKEGLSRKSLEDFEKALNIRDSAPGDVSDSLILLEAGRASLQCGENKNAFYYAARALKDKKIPPCHALLAQWILAGAFEGRGDPDRAQSTCRDAMVAARQQCPYMQALLNYQMGIFYLKADHPDEAVRFFVKAESFLLEPAGHLFLDESLLFPDFRSDLHEGIQALLIKKGLFREAFYFCLRAKDDEDRWPYRLMEKEIQEVLCCARDMRSSPDRGSELAKNLTLLNDGAREAAPSDDWFEDLVYRLDDRSQRLEYYTGKKHTFLYSMSFTGVRAFILPGGEEDLRKRLVSLREEEDQACWQRGLRDARTLLVGPAEGSIAEREKLLIGLHGILRAFPWPALSRDSGACLIDDYSIEYSQLLFSLPEVKERRRESRPLYLLCAAPVAGNAESAGAEVDSLASFLMPRIVLKGDQAAGERITASCAQASYAHLAGRWHLDSRVPDLCGLKCEKGMLSFRELHGLELPREQVMISAFGESCEENCSPGLALLGPLIYSGGAKFMAAAVSHIPLQERLCITEDFYRHIRKGVDPVRALRLAQISAAAKYPGSRGWAWYGLTRLSGCGLPHGQ